MRTDLAAVLAVDFGFCVACGNDQVTPDHQYLDALKRNYVTLSFPSGTTPDGDTSDESAINYGKGICDLVRRKGSGYDPTFVIKLDHKQLNDDQARLVVTAAMESYCPSLIR